MSLTKFIRTDPDGAVHMVYINLEAITAIMPALSLHPGGSAVCVHGWTVPILVDATPDEVATAHLGDEE